MSPVPGHRSGMAILTIEIDAANPERKLIRVKTIDDVLDGLPIERPFSDTRLALSHLRDWIDTWSRANQ